MKTFLVFWVESFFYNPNTLQKILAIFLSPFSFLYCFVVWIRFKFSTPESFGIDVISVGNLTVGGSGKTPLVTALANHYANVAIVLRGYGRESSGLHVVKDGSSILCDYHVSGDEAMIYADKVSSAIVIVSEDRKEGILKAKELGARLVFLDDAYSKHAIEKLDFLIEVDAKNKFCLPAGPFREKVWSGKRVHKIVENLDFKRVVTLKDKCDKMSLATAIARPQRLDPYLPDLVNKNYFPDHHNFTKDELENILATDDVESILVTYKDYVKVNSFGVPLSLLDLDVNVDERIFKIIDNYIGRNKDAKKN